MAHAKSFIAPKPVQDIMGYPHEKHIHEETRATFSHAVQNSHSVIVRNLEETKFLSDVILGNKTEEEFYDSLRENIRKTLMLSFI